MLIAVVLVAIAAVLAFLFTFAWWSRSGERLPDPEGQRTIAMFDTEDEVPEGEPPGEELMRSIAKVIAKEGLVVDEVSEGDHGWALQIGKGMSATHAELALLDEELGAEREWSLTLVGSRTGAPADVEVARAVDRALRKLKGVARVGWCERHRFPPVEGSTLHESPSD